MYSYIVVLSLAVFGASAAPCGTIVGSGCGAVVGGAGCGTAFPGPTTFGQTPVIENPTSFVPPYVPTGSVSQSCHCMKTIVRPQIRNEVITVPSVDRLVRYVTNPTVEVSTVQYGGNTRTGAVPTCTTGVSGVVGGVYPGAYGYNGVVGTGVYGNGLVGTGLVGNGVCGSGIVGTGLVGTGLVGGCGCGSVVV